ncbi:hypothetical protein KAU15_03930, partial [candidate division WOR-3 bacterium]|nr:hypothetical protein [candidate division WOR-3 bacterium]
MRKIVYSMIILIIGVFLFGIEKVSDEFDQGILSTEWNIIEEGIGGEYEFFTEVNKLDINGIKLEIPKAHNYIPNIYGLSKTIPTIIAEEFLLPDAKLSVSIPDYFIITFIGFEGPFNYEIYFNNGDIIKYVFTTIRCACAVMNIVRYYYNDVLVDDSIYNWVPDGTKITEENEDYPVLQYPPIMDLELKSLGDGEYQLKEGTTVQVNAIPENVNLFVKYQVEPASNGEQLLYYCIDFIHSAPDVDQFFITQLSTENLLLNYNNNLEITLLDLYEQEPLKGNAEITLETPTGDIVKQWIDGTQTILYEDINPQLISEIYELEIRSLETSQQENKLLTLIEDELECNIPEEIPVLDENEIVITVKGKYKNEFIPGVKVIAESNNTEYFYEGFTNSLGEIYLPGYIQYTEQINISFTKDNYLDISGEIDPVMLTTIPNALGKNNQNGFLFDYNNQKYILSYSDGDNIIIADKGIQNDYWHVEKIGEGENPTIVKTEDGLIVMWSGLQYSILSSPWTPIDTVSLPVCWSSEPTLNGAKSSVYKYGVYIGYRIWPSERGDLIFGKWLDKYIDYMEELDTVFRVDGSIEGIIPKASPITAGYIWEIYESHLIGCIDNNNNLVAKLWDLNNERWFLSYIVSNPGQLCLNPSIDFDGYNTTFVW